MQSMARRLLQQQPSLNSLRSLPSVVTSSLLYCGGDDYQRYAASTLASKGIGHLVQKGTGGRSSVSGLVATVFGATGFLGRYVVQQLAKMGSQVLVPFRGCEDSHRHLKLMGDLGQIVPMNFNPRDESSIKAVVAKANVVINLIGREYETRNYSFEEVNHLIPEALAMIAKEHGGIMRYIQVSCLGASASSPSRFLKAKAAGEEALLREVPKATIMRPAVMIGTEDRILNRWAHFAKNYSFLPLIGDGSRKIQPVYVFDVAAAIVAALKDDGSSMGKIYELGGPDVLTVHELAEIMYDMIREWPRYVKLPLPIAKAIATPRELLVRRVPFPVPIPNIFNYDEIVGLKDTIVSETALSFADLGIVPRKVKGYPVEYLISYRKGGPQFGSTVSEKMEQSLRGCLIILEGLIREIEIPMSDMGSTRIHLDNISLRENGFGATMSTHNGTAGESVDCFCINVDINSNVQGVSNSFLVGSSVRMGDSGVSLSFGDIRLEDPKLGDEDRKIIGYQIWNFWIAIVMVILLVAMLLLQIYY